MKHNLLCPQTDQLLICSLLDVLQDYCINDALKWANKILYSLFPAPAEDVFTAVNGQSQSGEGVRSIFLGRGGEGVDKGEVLRIIYMRCKERVAIFVTKQPGMPKTPRPQ